MPSARIVLCAILPRYQRNVHWRNIYENKREEFNTGLKVIGDQYSCILVHCPRLQEDDIIDGIHPSVHSGVPKLVRSYEYVLNQMLGLSNVHVDNRKIKKNKKIFTGNVIYRK